MDMAGQQQTILWIGHGKSNMTAHKKALFLGKKLLRILSLLVVICFVSFLLIKNSPIDPVQAYVSGDMLNVGPEQREKIAEYWGLNDPLMVQFTKWFTSLLRGDLGISMIYRVPVLDIIKERFVNSMILMSISWVLSGIFGFLLGVLAAMKKDTIIDRVIKTFCYLLASTPTFWFGLLMLMFFSVYLGWFPVGLSSPAGVLQEDVTLLERLRHLVLPALTLSILGVSSIALHTRQKLIEVLDSDYVLFAKARGEKGFTLFWRHGFRNILIPAITLQFAAFSELFGGSILAEQIFSYPGLGQATVESGIRGDTPLLLGLVIFSSLFVFAGNFFADILYQVVDPRTREEIS